MDRLNAVLQDSKNIHLRHRTAMTCTWNALRFTTNSATMQKQKSCSPAASFIPGKAERAKLSGSFCCVIMSWRKKQLPISGTRKQSNCWMRPFNIPTTLAKGNCTERRKMTSIICAVAYMRGSATKQCQGNSLQKQPGD